MKQFAPVDPVYRIPNLAINDELLVHRGLAKYDQFALDRVEWLSRREEYYLGWDDYQSPIRKGPWNNASNIHLPMTEIQANALHARIMQAFFFIEPWFYVDPQEELDYQRIQKIELMMKYIVMRYANYNEGIYSAIDDWVWDLVTEGMGILSRGWKIDQRRSLIVERNMDFQHQKIELQKLFEQTEVSEFDDMVKNLIKQPYIEKEVIKTVFNGPIIRAEDPVYVLFKGDVVDCTNLNLHETVMKVCYFTRDELIGFKESEFFDEEVVDEVISRQPDRKGGTDHTTRNSRVEYAKDRLTGIRTINPNIVEEQYEFLCVWDRTPLEVNGARKNTRLADELVYYIPTQVRKLARWTFLDRVSPNGKRNLHMAHLYRRPRRSIGRGMVETQGPLNDSMDMLFNHSIDAGMLANMPMFAYRKNSTFDPQEMRIEAGLGFGCDDPNNDMRFFTWNINPGWSQPFQMFLQQFAQQLTSLGPLSMGQVGPNVGPLRSGAGAQALLAETGTNLDIIIKRAKLAYSDMLEGLYADCIERMPDKLKITSTGPEGDPLLDEEGNSVQVEVSQEELSARVHFGLYANSSNMNQSNREAVAMKTAQFLLQPIAIQSGNVQPENINEILNYVVQTMRAPKAYRFISKSPKQIPVPLHIELLMIMQGITPPVVLNDPEHEQKIKALQTVADSDKAAQEAKFGVVNPQAMTILMNVIQKHQKFLDTMNKPTDLQNPTGSTGSLGIGGGGMAGNVPEEEVAVAGAPNVGQGSGMVPAAAAPEAAQ